MIFWLVSKIQIKFWLFINTVNCNCSKGPLRPNLFYVFQGVIDDLDGSILGNLSTNISTSTPQAASSCRDTHFRTQDSFHGKLALWYLFVLKMHSCRVFVTRRKKWVRVTWKKYAKLSSTVSWETFCTKDFGCSLALTVYQFERLAVRLLTEWKTLILRCRYIESQLKRGCRR